VRQTISSSKYYVPVANFTQAVKVTGGGTFIFLSGLTSRDPDGNIVGEGDAGAQTRKIMEGLRAILAEAGGSLDDVVQATTYMTNMRDWAAVHAVRREYFGEVLPASTTVQVTRLYDERQLLEFQALAFIPGRD